jgi:hypothetical protein
MSYDTLDHHPFLAAQRIMRFLVPDVTLIHVWNSMRRHAKAKIKKRTDALNRDQLGVKDVGFSWYESNTFFHRRHVSSLTSRSALERLSPEQVKRIQAALSSETASAEIKSLF